MAEQLATELERHNRRSCFRDDDLVFCHPRLGNVLDPSKVWKRFKKAEKDAELMPIRFHDLRHTFGVRTAAVGAPIRAIQDWMGHASITTTEIYMQWMPDPSQGAKWAHKAFGRMNEPKMLSRVSEALTLEAES